MRFALGVEYDGSDFSGWESQPGQRTVQSSLESALFRQVGDSPPMKRKFKTKEASLRSIS